MNVTSHVFSQVLIMILLISVGFIAYKLKILKQENERPLSDFILMIVVPALILNAYQRDYEPKLAKGLAAAFILAVLSHLIAMAVAYLFIRKKGSHTAIERFSVIYSNCGFMAIPLINAVLGSKGVFYGVAYMTIFNILSWTHGAFMISESKKASEAIKILFNPTIISIAVAVTFFFTGFKIPQIPAKAIEYIASLNTPLAMIVTGMSIARVGILKTLVTPRAYFISFLRLLLIPAITVGIFSFLPVDHDVILTNLIASASSCAVSGILFSSKYKKDSAYASQIVAISTVLSVFTIPLTVWFFEKLSSL